MAFVPQDTITIRRLRQGVGIVGMALPFAVTIGNAIHTGKAALLNSISGSYYTSMRDVFVGSMCAVGVFLIFYRTTRIDDILGTIAGTAAIAVALFPATPGDDDLIASASDDAGGIVHGIAATVLFLILAVFCFFRFPISGAAAMAFRTKARNITYYVCGVAIIVGLGLALLGDRVLPDSVGMQLRPLFWGQTIAVLAFGVAWFAKSNTLLPAAQA